MADGGLIPPGDNSYINNMLARQDADTKIVQAQLDRFTYKPGWTFRADPSMLNGQVWVTVEASQPDSRPGHTGDITIRFGYPMTAELANDEPEKFKFMILTLVREAERHEVHEWLRFDGEQLINPHDDTEPGAVRRAF